MTKPKYEKPKLFIPKVLKNGKKVASVAPGKRWYVYFRYEGQQFKFYKKINTFKTVSERRSVGASLCQTYSELLSRGWSPIDEKYQNQSDRAQIITLEEALLNALSHKKSSLKPSTYNQYHTAYNRFMNWCKSNLLAGVVVHQFKRKDFARYLNYLSEDGNNATSINNNKRAISALFSKLVADFVIDINPVVGIKTETSKPLKNRPFTAQQLTDILKECESNDPYLLNFIKFMVYAMLRPREVIRLQKKSIQDNLIFVDTKKGLATINIIDKLKPLVHDLVNDCNSDEDNLLSYKNQPLLWTASEKSKTNVFTRRFKKIKDGLGLDETYGLYSFRHTAIFHLYQSYLTEGLSHNEIINKLLPITRHKSEKELSAYLREVGAMLPPDYSERFTFNL
ncbi:tyrosine-type recombinase/integrase [Nonlabens arenilitoris]|uniref:tyrosine-type recombinase/integrase n=1 Tax=Nonlabens arenilitoris TaxID=1217969 RepID=UPI001474D6B6|nr:tyrosine-type recombinase/integrase [Nonlabens arenilitoris]